MLSFLDGPRNEQELAIAREAAAATGPLGPVTPPGSDEHKIAQPLNSSIYSRLTPTLANFTLRDKVAVITG